MSASTHSNVPRATIKGASCALVLQSHRNFIHLGIINGEDNNSGVLTLYSDGMHALHGSNLTLDDNALCAIHHQIEAYFARKSGIKIQ